MEQKKAGKEERMNRGKGVTILHYLARKGLNESWVSLRREMKAGSCSSLREESREARTACAKVLR